MSDGDQLDLELADLDGDALVSAVYDRVKARMDGLADADADAELARMPEPMRVLHVLDWLEFEMMQGGLAAYLRNAHRRHADLVVDALLRIGMPRAASLLADASGLDPDDATDQPEIERLHGELDEALLRWGERLAVYLETCRPLRH